MQSTPDREESLANVASANLAKFICLYGPHHHQISFTCTSNHGPSHLLNPFFLLSPFFAFH